MTRALLLSALLLTAQAGAVAGQIEEVFAPDTIVRAPLGPRIVLLGGETGGVAALRLSVPLREHPMEAGAGAVLAAMARERMEGAARQVGARTSVERTPWGIAYLVEGPEADIEYLTYLLRLGAGEPEIENASLSAALATLEADADRAAETPLERILATVRTRVAPGEPPLIGTIRSRVALSSAAVRAVWSRTHLADSMTVVARTMRDPEELMAMLDRIGNTGPAAPVLSEVELPPGERLTGPPPLRTWYAEAWVDPTADDAHAAVLSELLSARLTGGPGETQTSLRVERLHDRTVFVVAGASLPQGARTMRTEVSGVLEEVRVGASAEEVSIARARAELMYRAAAARPSGLVESVGDAIEATRDPMSAVRRVEALQAVTAPSLAAWLSGLVGPITVEGAR